MVRFSKKANNTERRQLLSSMSEMETAQTKQVDNGKWFM
jgi:hypothetical protein